MTNEKELVDSRLNSIQFVRFFAALSVAIFHLKSEFFRHGYIGVDFL